ncbi:hypothetical protein K5L04_07110 [Flavobacterium psychrophilum]|uniref:hypothetical protein n=1 Tax=Flavobacterium psychrophilum TaxID=96345 RepID=UPI001C8F5C56|nr:hypothetical protein [Flavobacterium psychrophilum]QZK99499.1 hypothetical protein K5L04_07110 [Flavobacterium psychrophilum]
MKLLFEINKPSNFKSIQRDEFLKLLKLQAQTSNSSLEKINSCPLICIVYSDDLPIGIGAIKQVYKNPFDKAEVSNLKDKFDFELGYLFVIDDINYRGFGIGKTISKLLLKELGNKNVFATTEENDKNRMKFILESLNFKKTGKTYTGNKTQKAIGLYLKQ